MHDLAAGFGYLMKGQRWVVRHGRQLGFGLLPGLITVVLYAVTVVVLVLWGDDLIDWVTAFADDWPSPWASLFRVFLLVVLVALTLLVAVLGFTATTLLVGQPFYEALSERVDRAVSPDGAAAKSRLPLLHELWISARDNLRILVRAALWGVLLFVLGFLPFVGQTVVPVIGFFVTGFFLVQELTAVALQRRGVDLRARLALLRGRKSLAWGFGAPLAVVFALPVVPIFLMPGAVAGATLLARDLMGEETVGEGTGSRATGPAGAPVPGQQPHPPAPYGPPPHGGPQLSRPPEG